MRRGGEHAGTTGRQRHSQRWLTLVAALLVVLTATGAALLTAGAAGWPVRSASCGAACDSVDGWRLQVQSGAAASLRRASSPDNGGSAVRVDVATASDAAPWHVQLRRAGTALHAGQSLTLTFLARSSAPRAAQIVLQQAAAPYRQYFAWEGTFTSTWKRFTFPVLPGSDEANAFLGFNLAQASGAVWISDAAFGEPAPVSPTEATASPYDIAGWHLIWRDEFNGAALDSTKWRTEGDEPGSQRTCCLYDGQQVWSARDVSVRDGNLILTSGRSSSGQPYESGAVTTQNTFSFTYGRVDIRAWLPRGRGLWSAFWLLPAAPVTNGYAPHEIDLLEVLGQDPSRAYMGNHWNGTAQSYCTYSGADTAAGFHVYSLVWTPTDLTWYVDGVNTCHDTTGIPQDPMYLILNTYVGGSWPVTPDNTTPLPQDTVVDYVRVYQPGSLSQ